MGEFVDLSILLFFGLCFNYFNGIETGNVVAFLLIIAICIYRLLYKKVQLLSYVPLLLSFFSIAFFAYLPCVFYIEVKDRSWRPNYMIFIAIYAYTIAQKSTVLLQLFVLLIAWVLRVRYIENEKLKEAYVLQRDNTKELALLLEEKNKNLMVRQEQEIEIATLNERNRIAREIHDHVGHLLSSSLLQLGALQAINEHEQLKQPLQDLRDTLSKGMDNVRESVHDLHEEAINLHVVLKKLCSEFNFCNIELEYDILQPVSSKQYYHIIAIIKESMTNTMKHSNATLMSITLREQPAFYQLLLQDNGSVQKETTSGIGLHNIVDRVDAMHGYCNINKSNGFLIFITIPKEEELT